jgi:hypothetical protein
MFHSLLLVEIENGGAENFLEAFFKINSLMATLRLSSLW